jgi:hypothetical protein
MQRIIFPWETKRWLEISRKVTEPMASIVDMDTKTASLYRGRKPRHMIDLFATYHNDSQFEAGRITKDHFVNDLLPMMQKLIADGPKTFRDFTPGLMAPDIGGSIILTRRQVATIVACMWFGLFDYRFVSPGTLSVNDFPDPTLAPMFERQNVFALQCVLGYLNRVHQGGDEFDKGIIVIKRSVASVAGCDWAASDKPLTEIFVGDGPTVDDTTAKLQLVGSYEYIGGLNMFKGALTTSEITLLIRPECLATMLFCAKMGNCDTITVFGAEKMSKYAGYGTSVRYVADHREPVTRGGGKTRTLAQTAVVFMDAGQKTSGFSQMVQDFDRDLNKAHAGMVSLPTRAPGTKVASANWTYCFNGTNMQARFIQLLLAASQADKCLVYHSFGRDFESEVIEFAEWLQTTNLTVGELYTAYTEVVSGFTTSPAARYLDLDVFAEIMDGLA